MVAPALPRIETQTWPELVACSFDLTRAHRFTLSVGSVPYASLTVRPDMGRVEVPVRSPEGELRIIANVNGVMIEGSAPARAFPLYLREMQLTPVASLGPSTMIYPFGEAEGVLRFSVSIPPALTLVSPVSVQGLRCDQLETERTWTEGDIGDPSTDARILQGQQIAIRSRRRGPIEAHYDAAPGQRVRLLERRGRHRRISFELSTEADTGHTSLRVMGWVDAANVVPIPSGDAGQVGRLMGTGCCIGGVRRDSFTCPEAQHLIARLPDGRHFAVGAIGPTVSFEFIERHGALVQVGLTGIQASPGVQFLVPHSTFASCTQVGR